MYIAHDNTRVYATAQSVGELKDAMRVLVESEASLLGRTFSVAQAVGRHLSWHGALTCKDSADPLTSASGRRYTA